MKDTRGLPRLKIAGDIRRIISIGVVFEIELLARLAQEERARK